MAFPPELLRPDEETAALFKRAMAENPDAVVSTNNSLLPTTTKPIQPENPTNLWEKIKLFHRKALFLLDDLGKNTIWGKNTGQEARGHTLTTDDYQQRAQHTIVPPDSDLRLATYGPHLSGAMISQVFPNEIRGSKGELTNDYFNLFVCPTSPTIFGDNIDGLKALSEARNQHKEIDASVLTPQLVSELNRFSTWCFGTQEKIATYGGVDVRLLDYIPTYEALKWGIALTRLGRTFNSPTLTKIGRDELSYYLYAKDGTKTSEEHRKGARRRTLPRILTAGVPGFMQELPEGTTGTEMIKMLTGKESPGILWDWIVGNNEERRELVNIINLGTRWGIAGAGSLTAIQIAQAISHASGLTPLEIAPMLISATGIASLKAVPFLQRLIATENLDDPRNRQYLDDKEGLLRKLFTLESSGAEWLPAALLDNYEIYHGLARPDNLQKGILLKEEFERVGINVSGYSEIELRKIFSKMIRLPVLDPNDQPEEAKKLLELIVPSQGKTIPLHKLMSYSKLLQRIMQFAKKRELQHPYIDLPVTTSGELDVDTIVRMGADRFNAIKSLAGTIEGLTVGLTAAGRVGVLFDEYKKATFATGGEVDTSFYAALWSNTGAKSVNNALESVNYPASIDSVFNDSHTDGVMVRTSQLPVSDCPTKKIRHGFQYINGHFESIGQIALWGIDVNPEEGLNNGVIKDILGSFLQVVKPDEGMTEGRLDYACRLIAANKFYEEEALDLMKRFPKETEGGITNPKNKRIYELAERAVANLKFVRRLMVGNIWDSFTKDRVNILQESNPLFTTFLIKVLQDSPESIDIAQITSLFSNSGLGKEFTAPATGVPTTYRVLVDRYLSQDEADPVTKERKSHVDPLTGLNKYGINPELTRDLREAIRKLIYDRQKDMLEYVYILTKPTKKKYPSLGTPEYNHFQEVFERAGIFFVKTLDLITDKEVDFLYNILEKEVNDILKRIGDFTRSNDEQDHAAILHNITMLGNVSEVICDELSKRHGRVDMSLKASMENLSYVYGMDCKEKNRSMHANL